MTVTVCIPAFRTGTAIVDTVQSALNQTYRDVKVVVAIDPPDEGSGDSTQAALDPLRIDPRLDVRANGHRLGWAENVNALLHAVDTPLYCILPHDDLWHPDHLKTLAAALESDPDSMVAYGDIMRFGATSPVRKGVAIPPGADRVTALLHFLLQGTEAQAWRGVTRTEAARRIGGFPTDRHRGFLVECAYALALHGTGQVIHVPRTLYFKRIHDSSRMSASRERLLLPQAERLAAWHEHDREMTGLLERALLDMSADRPCRSVAHAAKEAALLRQRQLFVEALLGAEELDRIGTALRMRAEGLDDLHAWACANLHMVMHRHWLAAGNRLDADRALLQAVACAETPDAVTAHAEMLLARGHPLEAIERASQALHLGHSDDTRPAQRVIDLAYTQLGWHPTC